MVPWPRNRRGPPAEAESPVKPLERASGAQASLRRAARPSQAVVDPRRVTKLTTPESAEP